jgi:nondiscriminating aspartyl-tRNA synthetase
MEITSGGQRINDYEELKKAFDERKIPAKNYSFYIDAFKYGMPPHGGFGLGLERYVKQIVEAGNVREAVLFPRDKNRLTP